MNIYDALDRSQPAEFADMHRQIEWGYVLKNLVDVTEEDIAVAADVGTITSYVTSVLSVTITASGAGTGGTWLIDSASAPAVWECSVAYGGLAGTTLTFNAGQAVTACTAVYHKTPWTSSSVFSWNY